MHPSNCAKFDAQHLPVLGVSTPTALLINQWNGLQSADMIEISAQLAGRKRFGDKTLISTCHRRGAFAKSRRRGSIAADKSTESAKMAERPVHWSEGLFLRPQHFQMSERHLHEQIRLAEEWNVGYAYGIHDIEVDTEALANYRIVVRKLHARLPGGEHVRYPGDSVLADLPFDNDVFRAADARVRVFVGVPSLQLGRANAGNTGERENTNDERQTRFIVEPQEVEDENRSGDPQLLDVRLQNARILIGQDQTAGYSALPIMQLKPGVTVDAPPEIDSEYFPPLLNCSAWPQLNAGILENIYDYLGERSKYEVQRFRDHKMAFNSGRPAEFGEVLRLQALNTAMGTMTNLPFVKGLHPLTAYLELSRIVGMFAIFDRNSPGLPEIDRYDHDDSAPRFYRLKKLICALMERKDVPYVMREFKWDGKQMRVRMDEEWFTHKWRFLIGINSSLGARDVRTLFKDQKDGLDLKVGASDDVDQIFRDGFDGIPLVPEDDPPHELRSSRWTYWNVDRNSHDWKNVTKSHQLGIRFKEKDRDHDLEGKVDGDTKVRLKERKTGEITELKLALFAMPAESHQ
jgi:type VI secretion system protein ImpJ